MGVVERTLPFPAHKEVKMSYMYCTYMYNTCIKLCYFGTVYSRMCMLKSIHKLVLAK